MVVLLRYIMLLGLGLLISCSIQTKVPITSGDAYKVWYAYERYTEQNEKENSPYRIKGTLLSYVDPTIKRLSFVIWGNGDFPIRLDGLVGMNTTVVQIYENQDEFVIYSPIEKQAKIFPNINKAFLELDVSLPFGLHDFVALIRGQFYSILGKSKGVSPLYMHNGNILYTLLGGKHSGTLELLQNGLPVKWEDTTLGWSLIITYDDQTKLPARVVVSYKNENKIVFIIKNREILYQNFPNSQLKLNIPKGVEIQYITYE